MTESIHVQTVVGSLELKQQIIPSRYVWHVSNSFFQRKLESQLPGFRFSLAMIQWYVDSYFELADQIRSSISEKGLLCAEDGAVFANQNLFDILKMHPIWLDHATGDVYNPGRSDLGFLSVYDFWRIDTHSFEATWYIDQFMEADINAGHLTDVKLNNYICTKSAVPTNALKLFRFDMSIYQRNKSMYNLHNGFLKVPESRDIWDAIQPDKTMNKCMMNRRMAA